MILDAAVRPQRSLSSLPTADWPENRVWRNTRRGENLAAGDQQSGDGSRPADHSLATGHIRAREPGPPLMAAKLLSFCRGGFMRDLRTLACAATFLVLVGSVARPGLQAQVQSPDPHNHEQEAPGATVEPAQHHQHMMKMMTEMKAADAKLAALVQAMKAAKSTEKTDAIAAVVAALAEDRLSMHSSMATMMNMMHMDMMGMMNKMGTSSSTGGEKPKP